eukprot:7377245-Prymnesium_polylepis.1
MPRTYVPPAPPPPPPPAAPPPPPPPPPPLVGRFDVSYLTLPSDETLTMIAMDDRRAAVCAPAKFLYQSELETLLY